MSPIFIAGTDTEVGKTYITALLFHFFKDLGRSPAVFKPIASGCEQKGKPETNPDLATLQSLEPEVPVAHKNIWCFDEAIAPHIAAQKAGQVLSVQSLTQEMSVLLEKRQQLMPFDLALIEGAGGWVLPLNASESLDQFVNIKCYDVVLVVGMKLGCLNHAALTASHMSESGVNVLGWVANSATTMPFYQENLETLKAILPFPLLAEVGPGQKSLNSTLLEQYGA